MAPHYFWFYPDLHWEKMHNGLTLTPAQVHLRGISYFLNTVRGKEKMRRGGFSQQPFQYLSIKWGILVYICQNEMFAF